MQPHGYQYPDSDCACGSFSEVPGMELVLVLRRIFAAVGFDLFRIRAALVPAVVAW